MGHLEKQARWRLRQELRTHSLQNHISIIGIRNTTLTVTLFVLTAALSAIAEDSVTIKNHSVVFKDHKPRAAQQLPSSEAQNGSEGFWFNKGTKNAHCFQTPKQLDCKRVLQHQTSSDKALNTWKLDYRQLLERITCTLEKLNCPLEGRSFQLHDIPCQLSCLEFLESCEKARSLERQYSIPRLAVPPGCPKQTMETPSWSRNPQPPPYASMTSNQESHKIPPYTGTFYARRYSTYGQQPAPLYPRDLRQYPRTYQPTPSSTYDYWRPRYRRSVRTLVRSLAQDTSDQLSFEQYAYTNKNDQSTGDLKLSPTDCYLLPPGGCEKWPNYWGIQNQQPSNGQNVKINPGCPSDLAKMCEAMFPREFNRQHWIKGEFTVASVIRISQTLWWFGENDLFQPFFRFHVLETLESDIHPYDDKMILTYSWPSRCVCPDELTVNKRYLMLTHSYKARQTLNITASTVFLSRVKRYSRRLACWKGACARSHRRNRRRRFPNARWHWRGD